MGGAARKMLDKEDLARGAELRWRSKSTDI